MIIGHLSLEKMFHYKWQGRYAIIADDCDISRMILRDKANDDRPEQKRLIRRIIEMIAGWV